MIRKKLMKHFKLRNVVKTMVLATAVTCGLTAGATTVKAEDATATPSPTPLPKVNIVLSTNSYEMDDSDYSLSDDITTTAKLTYSGSNRICTGYHSTKD